MYSSSFVSSVSIFCSPNRVHVHVFGFGKLFLLYEFINFNDGKSFRSVTNSTDVKLSSTDDKRMTKKKRRTIKIINRIIDRLWTDQKIKFILAATTTTEFNIALNVEYVWHPKLNQNHNYVTWKWWIWLLWLWHQLLYFEL